MAERMANGLDEFGNEWKVAQAPPRERTIEETISLWWLAMGSTVLISATPFVILFFVPLDGGDEFKPLLNVLLAFAAGGLLGDAFLHLIPHAVPPAEEHSHSHDHGHSHDHHGHSHNNELIDCNFWVLVGLLTFLLIEKFARVLNVGHSHSHGSHGHSHASEDEKIEEKTIVEGNHKEDDKSEEASSDKEESKEEKEEDESKADKKSENESKSEESSFLPKMEISGYLNLAADFSHNFTDGLAIGASYLAGNTVGIITTATILIHEVPHEIGDFAILIKSGCPRMKAIWLQSTTAIGAMIGCAIGLSTEFIGKSAINTILPFTAGGFIYIACSSILPELLESKLNSWKQVLKEILALFLGIYLMIVISWFE